MSYVLTPETKEKVVLYNKERVKELSSSQAPAGKTAIVRPLQPTDYGFTNNVWKLDMSDPGTYTPNAWNTYCTFTVPDHTYIGIYAIYDLSAIPVGSGVRFIAGASTVRKYHTEGMHACGCPYMVLPTDEQVIFGPGTEVTVQVYLEALSDSVKIGFDGWVGEPIGKTINKTTNIDP